VVEQDRERIIDVVWRFVRATETRAAAPARGERRARVSERTATARALERARKRGRRYSGSV
jgi:hypothetical protein